MDDDSFDYDDEEEIWMGPDPEQRGNSNEDEGEEDVFHECHQNQNKEQGETGGGGKKPVNGLKPGAETIVAAAAASGAKRLQIRNFQKRNGFGQTDFEARWALLRDAVLKIQQLQPMKTTGETLYTTVVDVCQKGYGPECYTRLRALIDAHARRLHDELVEATRDVPPPSFLHSLNQHWETFCQQTMTIRSVFLYLDRANRGGMGTIGYTGIWDIGLEAFRGGVVSLPDVGQRLVAHILGQIEDERNGGRVERSLLKSLVRMLISLQVYEQKFEPAFLDASRDFYERESRSLVDELEVGAYLTHVRRRLDEETERLHLYLDSGGTGKKLVAILDRCFVAEFAPQIIAKGLELLQLEERRPHLALMYELLARTKDGLPQLKAAFTERVKKIGKALVMDADRDKTLVDELMAFKRALDATIAGCFRDSEMFQHALQDAFGYFVNIRPNKIAELIAKFMDGKLRAGNRETTEDALEQLMDASIVLFRFVHGKDVFEAFYKRDLAKRLLLGRSASVDAEKAMLQKLRTECGSGLTQKMEGMFKDMDLSREFNIAFKQYLEGGAGGRETSTVPHKAAEFNVAVLTMGNWPNYPPVAPDVQIPSQLAELQHIYTRFYNAKHGGRRLQWQYSLTSAILKATFKPGVVKELDVSLFQAMVLLLFNNDQRSEWSYTDIAEHTRIDGQELSRTLQSLACGKWRLLHKTPKGRDVAPGDSFSLNTDFTDRLYRIRVSQVQMRETAAEHQLTEEQVFADRQYQIDAAIVRTMKMRKRLSHGALINELFAQLRFPAKSADLKKRIESLIEREYMARDKEDPQCYHYVT